MPDALAATDVALPSLTIGSRWYALCSDGKARTALITKEPDTFFSVPARVQVSVNGYRHTVTGFVYWSSDWPTDPVTGAGRRTLKFSANAWLPNARFLPNR